MYLNHFSSHAALSSIVRFMCQCSPWCAYKCSVSALGTRLLTFNRLGYKFQCVGTCHSYNDTSNVTMLQAPHSLLEAVKTVSRRCFTAHSVTLIPDFNTKLSEHTKQFVLACIYTAAFFLTISHNLYTIKIKQSIDVYPIHSPWYFVCSNHVISHFSLFH